VVIKYGDNKGKTHADDENYCSSDCMMKSTPPTYQGYSFAG
jgi:hypothetical protein